jgi:phosphoribosylformimino-5-aminoimidazole carboxamide ribotide isomerase
VAVAQDWVARGFGTLHVVDLDAALGSGSNEGVIGRIVAETPAVLQVGGGIRNDERADALLGAGVARIVVGTRSLDDPQWLAALADRWPGRVILALDTRDGFVLRKGWTEATPLHVDEYLAGLAESPLAGILSTDVGREGRLSGIDRDACRRLVEASERPMWISGGITTLEEIAYLADAGAAGVVLGMAVYTGAVDVDEVAARWGSEPNWSARTS